MVPFVHCHFCPWTAFIPQSPLLDLGWHGSHVEDPRGWRMQRVMTLTSWAGQDGDGWALPLSSCVSFPSVVQLTVMHLPLRLLRMYTKSPRHPNKKCPCHLFLVAHNTSSWPSTISMAWWCGTFHPLEMSLVLRGPYIWALNQSLFPEMTTASGKAEICLSFISWSRLYQLWLCLQHGDTVHLPDSMTLCSV